MKVLLPSLKEKKRYLAFEIISENKFSGKEIKNAVEKNALNFMGTLDYGKAGVMMLKNYTNKGILRVNNKFVDKLKVSLMMIKEISNKKVTFKTIRTSGMINKLLKEAD